MGLDMFVRTYDVDCAETDVVFAEEIKSEELQYWRKHHDLHGWMESLYREKGGKEEEFNCVNVRLNVEDLDRLEKDLVENNLPHTEGFFFGNNPPDSESLAEDLQFIANAREAINKGKSVYYSSWW